MSYEMTSVLGVFSIGFLAFRIVVGLVVALIIISCYQVSSKAAGYTEKIQRIRKTNNNKNQSTRNDRYIIIIYLEILFHVK